ncbi:LysR family transcriptional regulator [Paenibacillus koleovorans]|uniref:LysR family transcriptional regulator n=1 Tax=Paenibacillus koleovorans TaxID=121608 RepID=UPI000FDC4FF7|nr:LysR family transcriptional regulator [Paenibacillus koleovorans]
MELRQLQYAIQIAAEKNFSRAAEKLHIAQPSLSQQLSKLEKEIGVLLFHRNTNAVELTHAGALFIEKAQKVIDMMEQIKQEMDDISHTRKGRLTVGTLPMTGSHILPLVLPVFQSRFPEIEVVLVEDSTLKLEQLTANGQTDLSLLTLPLFDDALSYQPLIDEEIILAMPPQHPLTLQPGLLDMKQLEHEPFIVLKKGQGFRQIALDLCNQAGFSPNIVFESTNIETVQSLVAAGMGIAFVPSMFARRQWSDLSPKYAQLTARPTRTLVISYRKGRYLSKAAEAFISTIMPLLQQYQETNIAGRFPS